MSQEMCNLLNAKNESPSTLNALDSVALPIKLSTK